MALQYYLPAHYFSFSIVFLLSKLFLNCSCTLWVCCFVFGLPPLYLLECIHLLYTQSGIAAATDDTCPKCAFTRRNQKQKYSVPNLVASSGTGGWGLSRHYNSCTSGALCSGIINSAWQRLMRPSSDMPEGEGRAGKLPPDTEVICAPQVTDLEHRKFLRRHRRKITPSSQGKGMHKPSIQHLHPTTKIRW